MVDKAKNVTPENYLNNTARVQDAAQFDQQYAINQGTQAINENTDELEGLVSASNEKLDAIKAEALGAKTLTGTINSNLVDFYNNGTTGVKKRLGGIETQLGEIKALLQTIATNTTPQA